MERIGNLRGTLPHSSGYGPEGSLISWDGYYYDRKTTLLQQWAEKMMCDSMETEYPTDFDGRRDFQCLERSCYGGKAIVRCFGSYGHDYPPGEEPYFGAKVAYDFMRNHPRTRSTKSNE